MKFRKHLLGFSALAVMALSACKGEEQSELQKLILEVAVQAEVETAKEEAKYLDLRGKRLAVQTALERREDLKVDIGTVIDMDESNRIVEAKISLLNTEMDQDPFYIKWYKLEKNGDFWTVLDRELVDEDWIVDKPIEELPISLESIKAYMLPHLQENLVIGTVGELLTTEEQASLLETLTISVTRSGLMFERLAPFVEVNVQLDDERFVGKRYRYVFDKRSDDTYYIKYKPVQLHWTDG